MADGRSILVTGAAGRLGSVGRTVAGLLLDRGFPVRAMVRREDERAASLRAAGAEVVVGDLLEPGDVYRVVRGCGRVYFGCEADDPVNAWAFNKKANPMGARLNAIFSSDIGHFDVPDMTEVVPEAYELVEHELITEDDFRDFMFANAVRFWGEVNPDFFKGTAVEKQAAEVLAKPRAAAAP